VVVVHFVTIRLALNNTKLVKIDALYLSQASGSVGALILSSAIVVLTMSVVNGL
jgi:hypothetical protein